MQVCRIPSPYHTHYHHRAIIVKKGIFSPIEDRRNCCFVLLVGACAYLRPSERMKQLPTYAEENTDDVWEGHRPHLATLGMYDGFVCARVSKSVEKSDSMDESDKREGACKKEAFS